ncbi:hypothetical protein J6590_054413 [Homalodisca vitripennis]|nr:hypothetical protein J6590_054413 [Homalodisca vitripennis]
MVVWTLLQVLALCWVTSAVFPQPVMVRTAQGRLRGGEMETYTGKHFFAFRGVRYAEAPVGDYRFKAPNFTAFPDTLSHSRIVIAYLIDAKENFAALLRFQVSPRWRKHLAVHSGVAKGGGGGGSHRVSPSLGVTPTRSHSKPGWGNMTLRRCDATLSQYPHHCSALARLLYPLTWPLPLSG